MFLHSLQFENVRNLVNTRFDMGEAFNIFAGPNASGKTSILEAINLLGSARSFRSHLITDVIAHGQNSLTVVAKIKTTDQRLVTAGIQKSRQNTLIRYDGRTLRSSSEIASRLPLILITPDSYKLITGGPTERRLLLDWAMFHVEPAFLTQWKSYERCLKQRNSALRAHAGKRDVQLWDHSLSQSANHIHEMRANHIQLFSHLLTELCERAFEQPITIQYLPGWDLKLDYQQQLADRLERDMRLGYTNRGPHRADLKLSMQGTGVKNLLSRGQGKLLTGIMRIAQARLIFRQTGTCPVVLVDDLAAELDQRSRGLFLSMLAELDTQVLITSTDNAFSEEVKQANLSVFHVEHGRVRKVV